MLAPSKEPAIEDPLSLFLVAQLWPGMELWPGAGKEQSLLGPTYTQSTVICVTEVVPRSVSGMTPTLEKLHQLSHCSTFGKAAAISTVRVRVCACAHTCVCVCAHTCVCVCACIQAFIPQHTCRGHRTTVLSTRHVDPGNPNPQVWQQTTLPVGSSTSEDLTMGWSLTLQQFGSVLFFYTGDGTQGFVNVRKEP